MNEEMSRESLPGEAYGMPRPDCPPQERLHRLALRDLGHEQRSRLQEHLNGCPACAAEHDVAVLFESSSANELNTSEVAEIVARLEKESPVRTAAGWRHARLRDQGHDRVRSWFVWQLAAAAAFVVVLTVSTWPHPPVLPSEHHTILRGTTVHTISPQDNVAVPPTQLAWQPHPEATTYRVRLAKVDDTVLWEGMVAGSKIDLPAAVGRQLAPLVRYIWTVEALNEAGALVAASAPQSFLVRPLDNPAPPGR